MQTKTCFLLAVALSVTSSAASAAVTDYRHSADFLSVLGETPVLLDLESQTVGTAIPSGSMLEDLTLTYSLEGGAAAVVAGTLATTSGSNYLGADTGTTLPEDETFLSGESLTIAYPEPVAAAGLHIVASPGDTLPDDFTWSAAGATVASLNPVATLADGGEVYFLGLVADTSAESFASATLSSVGDPADPFYTFTIDDLRYLVIVDDGGIPLTVRFTSDGTGFEIVAGSDPSGCALEGSENGVVFTPLTGVTFTEIDGEFVADLPPSSTGRYFIRLVCP